MRKSVFVLILIFFLSSLIGLGCAKKAKPPPKEPLELLERVLKEQKKQRWGRYGFIEKWRMRNVSYDELNGQILVDLEVETSENFLFLTVDIRKKGKNWFIYGLRKEDSLSKVDLEKPYRYWFRRFVFSTSLH